MINKNKMKELLMISMIFLSGCCAFTSQDCGCEPPNPELNEETLKWIAPYDNQDENTSVLINTDFEWNNEKIKVLIQFITIKY